MTKKRVLFISSYDPSSADVRSGTPNFMLRALENEGVSVVLLGPVSAWFEPILKAFNRLSQIILGKRYDWAHSPTLSRYYSRVFSKKLNDIKANKREDVILAPLVSTEIAYLKTDVPIIYLSDTSFGQVNEYYKTYSNYYDFSKKNSNNIEMLSLEKAAVVSYPSIYAEKYTAARYAVSALKLRRINWGANFAEEPNPERIAASLESRKRERTNCLFVGIDWDRKGGTVAVDAIREARKSGHNIELHICGASPKLEPEEWIHIHGFLSKNSNSDLKKISHLYETADIFLLPTKAESYGHVFCEAAAYGLPVITVETGGIPSIVVEGETGFMFNDPDDSRGMADAIKTLIEDEELYKKMAMQALNRYKSELSWEAWAKKLITEMGYL